MRCTHVNVPELPGLIYRGMTALFQRTDWYYCCAADSSLSKPHILPVVPKSRMQPRF